MRPPRTRPLGQPAPVPDWGGFSAWSRIACLGDLRESAATCRRRSSRRARLAARRSLRRCLKLATVRPSVPRVEADATPAPEPRQGMTGRGRSPGPAPPSASRHVGQLSEITMKFPTPTDPNGPRHERPRIGCGDVGGAAAAGAFATPLGRRRLRRLPRSGHLSGCRVRAGGSRSRRCPRGGIHTNRATPFYELDWEFLHDHPHILERHWETAWREGRV
jgi:hypothetical protein